MLFWYIYSSTLLCALSSWYRVSRKQARRRPPCHPRMRPSEWFSSPPPPREKARLGWRAPRSRSARRVGVSWRAAYAWPVPRRRVELRDNHTLLRTTEPPLHCLHCDRLTDSGTHSRLSQDADTVLGTPHRVLEPAPETQPPPPGT